VKFPETNKIHQQIEEKMGENAKLLEERLKQINWSVFLRVYASLLGVFLVSTFLIIAVIRAALKVF